VRNLNNVDVGGRPLRIDLADSDPYLEGKTTVRGELVDGGPPDSRGWRGGGGKGQDPNTFLATVPPGVQLPKNVSSLDHISQALASMSPSHLMEVLAQMKVTVASAL
jgi:cleavage stimulation factor subunit 2